MSDLDEVTLVRGATTAPTSSRRPSSLSVLLIAAVGLALGAVGAWWWARQPADQSPPSSPATSATEATIAPAEVRALPPLDQMDTFLRALLGALSSSPELVRWLATDDLIKQMANAIELVSRGASPAREVSVLRPEGQFETIGRPGQWTIDPASYHRYDGVATLVSTLDARSVADAYRTIQPRLDEAYRGLGRTEGSVDQAVIAALQVLIDTPRVAGPIRLVNGPGATYAFADPAVEKLPAAQKQLIRMGPQNAERIQTRLKEIQAALQR